MLPKEFSVGVMIKKGWKAMRDNLAFFISFIIAGIILTLIPLGISVYMRQKELYPVVQGIIYVIYYFVSIMVTLGLFKVALDISRGNKGEFKHLFTQFPKVWSYFIASILYTLMLLGGLLLLVFPAFFWGAKYCLFPFFIVDKNAGPIEALKMSGEATEGAKWDILAFWLVGFLIALAGVLAFVVGIFAAAPTIFVGKAYIYRKLTDKEEIGLPPQFVPSLREETLIATSEEIK